MDQATNASAPVSAPAQGASGSPVEFKVPDGYRLTPVSEYDTLSRTAQKGRDADRWYGAAKELGFENPDSLKAWKPAFDAFGKRKIDPKFLASAFGDAPLEDGANRQNQNAPAFDPAQIEKKFEQKLAFELARRDHDGAAKNLDSIVGKVLKDIHGDKSLTDDEKWLWEHAVYGAFDKLRSVYPEGHPLREYDRAPVDEKMASGLVQSIRDLQQKSKAAAVAAKAEKFAAASKPPSPTVAAPGTGQGRPAPEDHARPGGKPSREAVEAAYAAKLASRGR